MAEPVQWQADGTPRSARFDDVYRSAAGGLEQARHVFLQGCGLPEAWAGRAQWRILETGFGLGLNFLAAWRAWKDDPHRPRILHFVCVEAWPVGAEDIVRSVGPYPELQPMAHALAQQWFGLVPGVHRLSFEDGQVLLTLHVSDATRMLRREPFIADSVFLDGFDPQCNPAMWDMTTLKAVARHSHRGTTLATWTVAGEVRRALAACGFEVAKSEGLPPKRHCTRALFDPAWQPKGMRGDVQRVPGDCIVVGAGLAGAACAASLARRGWRVTVLDAGPEPACGASGLPVGLMTPHSSPDDNLLSRLTRSGVRITLHEARELLVEGRDWRPSGVLEHRIGDASCTPVADDADTADDSTAAWQRPASIAEKSLALLEADAAATWHQAAAWIRPQALVRAWLGRPGIEWHGNARIESIERDGETWLVRDASRVTHRAHVVIVAAAQASAALLGGRIAVHPVRGQIAWAPQDPSMKLPPFAINGNGHFIPSVANGDGVAWYCGSTYGRDDEDDGIRVADADANFERLTSLAPHVAAGVAPAFRRGDVRAWAGVRCASADRRPLAGEVQPGLWVSTAMGSRGLTFCALAAELIAAQLHDEPLPLDARLAQALHPRRQSKP
jgi:tRNA 5-methylaminomethyl-2-thiouridine biosynthesis bifunctional protein